MGGRRWRRIVAQVVARDGMQLRACGDRGATSADHVVRVRDGGEDSLENLRAAHIECNCRRA
jgi:5-methylcytosine-specific restriction endonuclease McrA